MRSKRMLEVLAVSAICLATGLLSSSPANAVANGESAPPGAYPFSVKFTMTDIPNPDGTTRSSACSGALVAPQWVITAGHCFHDVNRVPVSGPVPYPTTATLGTTDLGDPGGYTLDVVEVSQSPVNDIALAKLAAPVTGIKPLTVIRQAPSTGEVLELAGWGATSSVDPTPSTHLFLGQVAVSSISDTTVDVHGVAPSSDTSACLYDSGAPYFVAHGMRSGELVSVESNGPDCPHATPETTSRVDVIVDWIWQQLASGKSGA